VPELTAAEFAAEQWTAALDAHTRQETQMNTQLDPALEPDRGPLQTLHSAGLQPDPAAWAGPGFSTPYADPERDGTEAEAG
jgi:hypothetical protein